MLAGGKGGISEQHGKPNRGLALCCCNRVDVEILIIFVFTYLDSCSQCRKVVDSGQCKKNIS